MYNTYPNIIDSLCNKTFKYKKGRVYFHNLYQRKLNEKHRQRVDQTFTLNKQIAKCFQYDTTIPLQQNGIPDICDCLNAHTEKYKRGQVPIEMIYREEPLKYHNFPVPTVIDAMNGHCNKYKKGKVQLNDIYRPDILISQISQQHDQYKNNELDLSEFNERYQWEIDLLGIA